MKSKETFTKEELNKAKDREKAQIYMENNYQENTGDLYENCIQVLLKKMNEEKLAVEGLMKDVCSCANMREDLQQCRHREAIKKHFAGVEPFCEKASPKKDVKE